MFVIIERTFVYLIHETMKIGNSTDSSNDLSFFPYLPKKKDSEAFDKLKGETICSKKSTRHSSLLPGMNFHFFIRMASVIDLK